MIASCTMYITFQMENSYSVQCPNFGHPSLKARPNLGHSTLVLIELKNGWIPILDIEMPLI